MKLPVFLIGLVTTFLGAAPILAENKYLPEALSFIPISGGSYYGLIIAIGLLTVLYGLSKGVI